MQIVNIKESGANNLLMWALSNGANIKKDFSLSSLINDELCYFVTIEGINFFELFRLTQIYRDKLRIVQEKPADLPSKRELEEYFPGVFSPDDNPEKSIPLHETAEHVILNFINLTSQMNTDNDIIHSGAIRLFFPMITRKFNIQIPVAFIDFINSMTDDEATKVFSSKYPETLQEIIVSETHSLKTRLTLEFVKFTQILKYDETYDQYLKLIKYAPLKTYPPSKLYKLALLAFSRRDNISRGEIRCSLFKPDPDTHPNVMKRIGSLSTPLELDFVIQLPIQYMQTLENSYGNDILPISYESSMGMIIDGGIVYEDFKTFEHPSEVAEGELKNEQMKAQNHNNAIEAYRVRIAEANQILLNTIPILIKSPHYVDITNVFAMLPSIYMAKAVIRVNIENLKKLTSHSDPLLANMFKEISDISVAVNEDIRKYK